jgi:16S rRNA (uracil1498-N3)-methyltransferase
MHDRAPPPELLSPIRHADAIAVGVTIELDDLARRKLVAREINVKEAFTIVDRDGAFFRASLKAPGSALVYERMSGSTESPARITLVCAVLARQRMIPVVQKATELGCVRIVPVLSDHAVKRGELDKEKPWAWPAQALRAARQCRRASVPEVLPVTPLDAALGAAWFRDARARFVLDDRAPGAAEPFAGAPEPGDYVLVVGPEGGWSDAERARLSATGATPLSLGTRVLRAETAVYAGLTVLQHRLGDLR